MLIDFVVKYYCVSYLEATEIINTYREKGELAELLLIVSYGV